MDTTNLVSYLTQLTISQIVWILIAASALFLWHFGQSRHPVANLLMRALCLIIGGTCLIASFYGMLSGNFAGALWTFCLGFGAAGVALGLFGSDSGTE